MVGQWERDIYLKKFVGSAKSLGLLSDRAALNDSEIHVIDSLCLNIVAFTETATYTLAITLNIRIQAF